LIAITTTEDSRGENFNFNINTLGISNMRQRRPPINYCLLGLNVAPERIPQQSDAFSLTAQPRTDLWRKPMGEDTTTAPVLFTPLRFAFVSAEVTVSASWALEWDQAGLVIFTGDPPGETVHPHNSSNQHTQRRQAPLPSPPPEQQDGDSSPPPYPPTPANRPKWAKVGLEYSNNTCHASSAVATADGADWSATSIPPLQSHRGDLRVKLERLGQALWLSYHDESAGWRKFREVTGFFCGVEDKTVRIGVYASRPAGFNISASNGRATEELERNLTVDFEDLVIF
jgi:regulation of enolase protein 1 (concanavalin A-like superfamily)